MRAWATATVERGAFPDAGAVGRLMRPLAERVAKRIRQRTRRGRDVRGRPFRKMADGSRADLRDSGKMIDSFKPRKVTSTGFELAPGRRESHRALLHQVGIAGRPKRQWIGLGAEIENDIDQVIDEWMGRR